jgi:hypothetical protein
MNRCVPLLSPPKRRVALAIALAAATLVPLAASARNFPQNALRGKIVFVNPPDIELDGDAARMSPGVRIHGFDNMMVVSGSVAGTGSKYVVDYTREESGLVSEVWLLTTGEADVRPWPRTPKQAAEWKFDFLLQTWTKP